MEYSALIVAAGQGRRMNLGYNKVFYTFADGKNVLEKTMSIFEADSRCKQIVIVTQREDYVRCMRNRTQRGNVVFVDCLLYTSSLAGSLALPGSQRLC